MEVTQPRVCGRASWTQPDGSLDLEAQLHSQVLRSCLGLSPESQKDPCP